MIALAINDFNVSYPNFEPGTIINPDEVDVNFADVMIRMNQIIDVLNQITDGIGGNGSDIIDIGDVLPFVSTKLQPFLEEFLTRLQSTQSDASGAKFIGTSFIPDVQGGTVQDVLESLHTLHKSLEALVEAYNDEIHERANGIQSELDSVEARTTSNETSITALQNEKLNASDAYTKEQTDTEIAHLESQVYQDMFTKYDTNKALLLKTDKRGNHEGTWQGVNLGDIANVVGASGVVIDTVRPEPRERLMWYNPSNNDYQLYLNGQWRINTRPTQIKKVHSRISPSAPFSTVALNIPEFNPLYDAFIVMKNSIFVAEEADYRVNPDGKSIIFYDTLDAGTTIDIIAFIATPAT